MEKYTEKLNKVNEDPEFQSFMTAEENYQKCLNTDKKIAREEGLAEGRAEGLAKGKNIKQLEIAKNLKDKGMSLKDIAEVCNLSIEEIKKI